MRERGVKMQKVECRGVKIQIPCNIPKEVLADIEDIRGKQPRSDYIREILVADTQAKTNKIYVY